jgi:PEGA domain
MIPVLAAMMAGGCVERTMTFTTRPSGALVYLNRQEIGRTPVTRHFIWYGGYDLALRKDGYQTLKTTQYVKAPIYQIIPLDLFAAILPFHFTDAHTFSYTLAPLGPTHPQALLQRAQELKKQLRPSQRPATQPAAR